MSEVPRCGTLAGMERPSSVPTVAAAGFIIGILSIGMSAVAIIALTDVFAQGRGEYGDLLLVTLLPVGEGLAAIPLVIGSIYLLTGRPGTRAWITIYTLAILVTILFSAAECYLAYFVIGNPFMYAPSFSVAFNIIRNNVSFITFGSSLPFLVVQHIIWLTFALRLNSYVNKPPVSDWLEVARHAHEETRD